MAVQKVIFDDYSHGMNNRRSARMLYKHVSRGFYSGPFPEIKNLDRRNGWLEPAGSPEKLGATDYGVIQGMHVHKNFTGDNLNSATDETIYIAVWRATYGGGADRTYIYRLSNSDPYGAVLVSAEALGGDTGGTNRVYFESLGDKILVYTSGGSADGWYRTIRCVDDFKSGGTWTLSWSGTTPEIAVTGLDPFETATTRWDASVSSGRGSMMYFTVGGSQYYMDVALLLSSPTSTVIYGNAIAVGLTNLPNDTVTGELSDITITGLDDGFIDAPTVAPKAETYGTGSNLTGTYNYAHSYGTYDGMESDIGPWSDDVSPDGDGVLVYGLGGGKFLSREIDKVNIYRRGGTLGTTGLYAGRLYLPHRYNDDATNALDWAHLDGTTQANATMTCHNGEVSGWPTAGVAFVVGSTVNGGSYPVGGTNFGTHFELVKYLDRTDGTVLDAISTAYGWSAYGGDSHLGAGGYDDNRMIVLDSHLDDTIDASLSSTSRPRGHGDLPDNPVSVALSGNRLYVAVKDSNQLHISNTEHWRYFRDSTQSDLYDLDDQFTGGYIAIGSENDPIVRVISHQPSVVMVFKENSVYRVSGRAIPSMRIEKMENFPGCTAPDTVTICDLNVVWMHNSRVWLWDGDATLAELTLSIDSLDESGVQNLDDCIGYYWNHKYYLVYDKSGDDFPFMNYVEWDFQSVTQYGNSTVAVPSASIGDYMPGKRIAITPDTQTPYGVGGTATEGYIYKLHGKGSNKWNNDTDFSARAWRLRVPDLPIGNGMESGLLEAMFLQTHSNATMPTASFTFTPRIDVAAKSATTYTIDAAAADAANADFKYAHLTKSLRGGSVGGTFEGTVEKWTATTLRRAIERTAIEAGEIRPNMRDRS